ncbi:MAG: type II secretion system protein GspG [Patescibacteria group bacterium]
MKKSFTLVEILVVATIIVLLTAATTVTYSTFLKQSRDAKRKADLGQISSALEMYRSNNDTYPITGLSQLTAPTIYIQTVPTDPKNPTYTYYYTATASDYTLGSYLEGGGTTCVAGQCGGNCSYCLGPYGQK